MTEAKYFNSIRTLENGRYNEKIEAPTGLNSGYDLNGNILKLVRYGKTNSSDWGLMDQLTYTYTGNQLTRVDDAIATNANEGGFRESVETTNEYGTYNQNGSITKDLNKGVNLINYNHLNLVKRVEKSATEYIIYTYDATGRKLAQQVFGPAAKTTDYMGENVYENNALQYILHEEGRVVADQSVGALYPWEYEYFLKDHLGNVRVTFSEKTTSTAYSATMENNTQASEQSTFDGYSNGTRSSFHPFDHTDAGTTYTYSQLLNGGNNNQVGLAKSFEVKAGDVLDLEVYAKYEAAGTTTNNPNTIITALIAAFGISSSGSTPLEGPQALNAFNSTYAPGPVIGRLEPYEDNVAPRAYLNYILFDENFALVDFGFDQISTSAQQVGVSPIVPHDYLNLHVKVKKKGYWYVYLSNEQAVQTNVYFDDLKIVHHTGVKNTADYYPFGLTYNRFDADGSIEQRYQFNGKELQDELDLRWLDYGARMYHGDVGRWSVVDPLAELAPGWTPYRYAFNNPVRYIDPDGRVEKDHRAKTVQSGNDDGKNDPMEISRKAYHKDGKFHVDINYRDFSPSTGAPGFGSLSGFFNEYKSSTEVNQDERVVGEWRDKPNFEISAIEEGKPRAKVRLNPGGKIGIGVAETDYAITATISATIIAKRYCGEKLVGEAAIEYCAVITKIITVGVGVSTAPWSWWNTAKSVTTTVVKIPDFVKGAEYYLAFMEALDKIGESNVIPQEVAENYYGF